MRKKLAGLALVAVLALPAAAHAVSLAWAPNNGDATAYNIYRNGARVATVPHDQGKLADVASCFDGQTRKMFTWQDTGIPYSCADHWTISAVGCEGAESGQTPVPPCPPRNPEAGFVSGDR